MSAAILSLSPRVRPTPYTERVEEAGVAAYSVYNHMRLPLSFGSVVDEYHHLKQHVQVWDVACERQVEIRGPDAARLVQLMTPRDLSRATPGVCLYAPLADEAGGMMNDPIALKLAEDRFWLSIADSDVLFWAKGLAYGLGLDVSVTEPDVSPLAVQGPKAGELASRVFGDTVRQIRFFRFDYFDFHGHPLLVARSGWSGQGGFEIYLDDAALGTALWDELFEKGADLNVRPGCPNGIERIETGLLSYGSDMTNAHNPFECALDKYCHLDQPGEFMAREALEKVAAEGIMRRLVGLRIDTDRLTRNSDYLPVHAGGARIGQVSSVTFSPDFGCSLALAMLDRGYWTPGAAVEVEAPDQTYAARVSEVPFKR